jgi:hypothetical protein
LKKTTYFLWSVIKQSIQDRSLFKIQSSVIKQSIQVRSLFKIHGHQSSNSQFKSEHYLKSTVISHQTVNSSQIIIQNSQSSVIIQPIISSFLFFIKSFRGLGLWCLTPLNSFNNISVISWQSVLLVEETGVPGENHQPVASYWQTLSHNVVLSTPGYDLGGSISQLKWWWALIAQVVVNPTTIRSQHQQPPKSLR